MGKRDDGLRRRLAQLLGARAETAVPDTGVRVAKDRATATVQLRSAAGVLAAELSIRAAFGLADEIIEAAATLQEETAGQDTEADTS